jgi:hypothetical protein
LPKNTVTVNGFKWEGPIEIEKTEKRKRKSLGRTVPAGAEVVSSQKNIKI